MSTNPPALPDALPDVLIEAYSTAPDLFMSDLLRYVLGAGIVYLIIHLWLAQTLAPRRIQARLPRPGQVRREILASLRSVTVFAIIGPLVVLEMLTGVSQAYADPMARGPVWFLVSLIILIIAHDTWFYWTHRLMHQPRWFRRFHRLHHQSKTPTPWTAYAFNVGEAALHALFLPVILLVLPVPLPVLFLWGIHQIARNAIGHCGVEIFPARKDGRPLIDWVTTVTHHDLHHAQPGTNFGLYFTWWDRWMGTENPDYHARFAATVRRRSDPLADISPAARSSGKA
jgi:Delta7-sterol 5-desaturase